MTVWSVILCIDVCKHILWVDVVRANYVEQLGAVPSVSFDKISGCAVMIDFEMVVEDRLEAMRKRTMPDIVEECRTNKRQSIPVRNLCSHCESLSKKRNANGMLEPVVFASVRRSPRAFARILDCSKKADVREPFKWMACKQRMSDFIMQLDAIIGAKSVFCRSRGQKNALTIIENGFFIAWQIVELIGEQSRHRIT